MGTQAWLSARTWPNTYEDPSCQGTNDPSERFFLFSALRSPG
jgi:hypothetical protein